MILGALASLLLVALGYFPLRLVTGARYAALLGAPIVAALLLSLFAIVCIPLRCSIGVAVVATAAVSVASGVLVLVWRRALAPPEPHADGPAALVVLLGALIPLATMVRAPVGYDARSIWWFHAKWWADGGGVVLDAMRNPAFRFSHGDYPPLASATNGALWFLLDNRSLKEAQVVTAVLGVSALATLGFAVWRLFIGRLPTVLVTGGVCFLVLAGYQVAHVDPATNGYVDVLWAGCFAAAAVFLLATPPSEEALRWGALLLAAAALTKQEALVAAILVAGLAVLRARMRPRVLVLVSGALVPGVLWLLVTRIVDVPAERWRVGALLRADSEVTSRIEPTLHWLWRDVRVAVVAAAVITVLGWCFVRAERRSVTGDSFPWLWAAWGVTMIPLVLAYVVSTRDLSFHLSTSADRTTIAPNLVLVAEIAIWTFTAVAALTDESRSASVSSPLPNRTRNSAGELAPGA